jgi:hypothetical protein
MRFKIRQTEMRASLLAIMIASTPSAYADALVHNFQNPSFSGVGYSAHVLTIENLERTRKDELQDAEIADLLAAERDAENTVEARFLRNLESRIYSQLSRQLVDNLFGETVSESGSFELLDSTISFENDGENVTLRIENEDGVTELVIPVNQFLF